MASTLPTLLAQDKAVVAGAAVIASAPATIILGGWEYTAVSVGLGLAGVLAAREITIGQENKRLGRKQTWRETMPLTAVAVLIVAPMIAHFDVAVPWASLIGLGVGYSTLVVLRILGGAATAAARAAARSVVDSMSSTPVPPPPVGSDGERIERALGDLDDVK